MRSGCDSWRRVQAVSVQPDTPEALTGLGLSYKELGQLQQAEQAFESVLRYQPDNALALGNIAGLYFDQGKLPQVASPLLPALAVHVLLWTLLQCPTLHCPVLVLTASSPTALCAPARDCGVHGGSMHRCGPSHFVRVATREVQWCGSVWWQCGGQAAPRCGRSGTRHDAGRRSCRR